jgi:hypothetical protein
MLQPDQAKALLLHPDRFIRRAAGRYLAVERPRDPEPLLLVIEAGKRYGWIENRSLLAAGRGFPVNGSAFEALCAALESEVDPDVRAQLAYLVARGPVPHLLRRREPLIAQHAELAGLAPFVQARIEAVRRSGAELLAELESVCTELDELDYDSADERQILTARADAAVEFLAPTGLPDSDLLARMLQDQLQRPGWLEVFLLGLIEQRRAMPLLPHVWPRLEVDGDYAIEAAMDALGANPAAATVAHLRERYPHLERLRHEIAIEVLGRVHVPEAEEALLAWLETERDTERRTWICMALCDLFSRAGVPAVLAQIEHGYARSITTLEADLLVVLDVLGISHPQSERWRADREREARRLERLLADLTSPSDSAHERGATRPVPAAPAWPGDDFEYAPPIARTEPRIGRNEPCPCGSGKKYKKCCLKQDADAAARR